MNTFPNDYDWISVHGPNHKEKKIGYKDAEAFKRINEVLNAPNTEDIYTITGVRYYFSSFGDDNNDGLSPETPLKSLNKLKDITFRSGDALLFQRNSVYRVEETIWVYSGVTVGCYGEGEKPRFYGSLKDYAVGDYWTKTENDNVWVTDFLQNEACGMFFDHGRSAGTLWKAGIDSLKNNYDYHHDVENKKVYLYFDGGNPGECHRSIEITYMLHHMFRIDVQTHCVIDNLCIKFTGGFPIVASGQNITVTNCEIGYAGGLTNVHGTRFGNAIEFCGIIVDIRVEHNWIYEIFDSALTWQMGSDCVYENISFSHNLLEYNNADIEFFAKDRTIVNNFLVKDNLMRFTSSGWGTHDEERGVRWIEGCVSAWTALIEKLGSLYFTENIMDCPARWVVHWRMRNDQRGSIKSKGNKLYIKESYRTSDVAVRGIPDENEPIDIHYLGRTAEEMKESLKRFDETLELEWHNE